MAKVGASRPLIALAGIFAAAISVLAYVRYRRDLREAHDRIAAGSEIAWTTCGPIEYALAGEGPPVLLVHGAGGGYDQALEFGTPLAACGFRIIAMSRFGYLRTPLPPDASAVAQADAHAALLDALGIREAAIVGASAGAPSALQFALRHPDRCRALILLVPAAYVPRPDGVPPLRTPPWTEFLFRTALRSDFVYWAATRLARSTVIGAMLATPAAVVAGASPEERARIVAVMEHVLPVSARRLGLLNDAEVVASLQRYELERITVPTLALSVADDLFGTFDPARYTAEQIPGARFVGYETGGHLWVGHHEEALAAIGAFLKEPREGQAPA